MTTQTLLTLSRQLASARRRLCDNDARVLAALQERGLIEDEIAALQQQYRDTLEAPQLARDQAAAVAEVERWLGRD